MDNLSFLKEVLLNDYSYWIVARKEEAQDMGRSVRRPDSIWLISLPIGKFKTPYNESNLLLGDIEKLKNCEVVNIPLSENYAPFQQGISFYNIYRGYPVEFPNKEFLIKALAIGTNNIWDYKTLCETTPPDSTTL